jgi:RNA polymerase sigma factor (sigma-70 family)
MASRAGLQHINARAMASDRRAAAEDVRLRESLRRFVAGRVRDHADGEDIVQETYVRLYDYGRSRTIGDVGAFCFAVARNLLNDHLRRQTRQPITEELTDAIACPAPSVEEALGYRERVEVLIAALKLMPPLRREIFTRRRLDDIATARIAADLDMSVAAVEKHCTCAPRCSAGAWRWRGGGDPRSCVEGSRIILRARRSGP